MTPCSLSFSVAALPARAFPGPHPRCARRVRAHARTRVSMNSTVPLQERVLRLERALNLAISQERFRDAATLRDALAAIRRDDPSLSARDALAEAVEREDYVAAAKLRDEIAQLTELLSRQALGGRLVADANGNDGLPRTRRVDRIVVLRSRQDQPGRLRAATISRDGTVELPLEPPSDQHSSLSSTYNPRIYLQPCFSPSGDYVCMTEISFKVLSTEGNARVVSMSDSAHRVCVMNAFDGTIVKSVPVRKPPFFYCWSPCGTRISMLYNGATSSSSLPSVSMSFVQVVAPASGSPQTVLSNDFDAVVGPVVSGHPLLYEFCPRDSNRVVAHIGDRSEVVVASLKPGERNVVVSRNAGAFGTPQWHPISGKSGREAVLFVEASESAKDDVSLIGVAQPRILRTDGLSDLKKSSMEEDRDAVSGDADASASLTVSDEAKSDDDNAPGESPPDFWSTLSVTYPSGSASNFLRVLEDLVKRGVRSLGVPLTGRNEDSGKKSPSSSGGSSATKGPGTSTPSDRAAGSSERKSNDNRLKKGAWGRSDKKPAKLYMCDVESPHVRRCLCSCNGVVSFKLSPDGLKLALLVNNPETGEEELSICEGDFSPDSVADPKYSSASGIRRSMGETESAGADIILSTPDSKVLAFFWSPDATKLLFLTSTKRSGAGAARWSTFDSLSNRVARYSPFILSAMAAHSMSFFCAFANSMTPWSPDSDAFCYAGRPLTPEEEKMDLDDDAVSQANAATLLTSLMLQKKKVIESAKGLAFSACVQKVGILEHAPGISLSRSKLVVEPPQIVLENVELAAWSQC